MLSGPLKKKKSDSERQEVTVNFVAQEGAVTKGDSLEGAVGKLPWKQSHKPLPSNYANSLSHA